MCLYTKKHVVIVASATATATTTTTTATTTTTTTTTTNKKQQQQPRRTPAYYGRSYASYTFKRKNRIAVRDAVFRLHGWIVRAEIHCWNRFCDERTCNGDPVIKMHVSGGERRGGRRKGKNADNIIISPGEWKVMWLASFILLKKMQTNCFWFRSMQTKTHVMFAKSSLAVSGMQCAGCSLAFFVCMLWKWLFNYTKNIKTMHLL